VFWQNLGCQAAADGTKYITPAFISATARSLRQAAVRGALLSVIYGQAPVTHCTPLQGHMCKKKKKNYEEDFKGSRVGCPLHFTGLG